MTLIIRKPGFVLLIAPGDRCKRLSFWFSLSSNQTQYFSPMPSSNSESPPLSFCVVYLKNCAILIGRVFISDYITGSNVTFEIKSQV